MSKIKTNHLETKESGTERVKTFTVQDPADTKRTLAVTVNEMIADGQVEMAVAADTQEQTDANHAEYLAKHLSD